MNDDYISRKAVLKICRAEHNKQLKKCNCAGDNAVSNIRSGIINLPSSNVVEVKRGKWKVDETHDYEPYCSLCGHEPIAGEKYNYCPDCGADMRG